MFKIVLLSITIIIAYAAATPVPAPHGPILRGIKEGIAKVVENLVEKVADGPYNKGGYNHGDYHHGARGYNNNNNFGGGYNSNNCGGCNSNYGGGYNSNHGGGFYPPGQHHGGYY